MRRTAQIALLVALVACADDAAPVRRSLAEKLGPGEVRAGRIETADELLRGPGARSRIGDFKLYNDRIAVTVAAAGQSLGFHPYGGGIVDVDRVDPGGVTAFGEIIWSLDFAVLETSSVEIVDDGAGGREARVRVHGGLGTLPLYEALLGGILPSRDIPIEWTIDYVLEPDSDVLRIEHELFNTDRVEQEVTPLIGFFFGTGARPFFEELGFASSNSGAASPYYAAASEDVSYIFDEPGATVSVIFGESGVAVANVGDALKLLARERKTKTQYLFAGDGDLAATRAAWRTARGMPVETVEGGVVDEAGAPVPFAHVHVVDPDARNPDRNYVTRAIADAEGRFALPLEATSYEIVATTADGRVSASVPLTQPLTVMLPAAGVAAFDVTDGGRRVPVRIDLEADTPTPSAPRRYGEPSRPSGIDRIVFATDGTAQIELPAGSYTAYVSRGIEYEVEERRLTVVAGERTTEEVALAHTVDTPGWMTTDTHIHARLSPDSGDDDDIKTRALAAANLELPVSTDHEAVGDFNPSIEALGLGDWMHGIVGTEITTTRYGHFNAYPLIRDPDRPGNGRVLWYGLDPADMFAAARAAPGDPIVQVNHPRSTTIGYFELLDFDRTTMTGREDLSLDFDGIEVINTCGDGALDRAEVLDWFAFLDRGMRRFATGTMDDHDARQGRLGMPVTYVQIDAASPAAVTPQAFAESVRGGQLSVSCGPFIDMQIGDTTIGGTAKITDRVDVDATVAAAGWVDVDEVLLIVDGEVRARAPVDTTDAGVRFSGTLSATVTPGRDHWAIVWARGDDRHGPWANGDPSFGFTNPIYLDAR